MPALATPALGQNTHDAEPGPHVVMVPLPGQGHISPFVSIAQYLAASGISVTLVHSARTHSLLAHSGNSNAGNKLIRIEVVPDGLPSGNSKRGISVDSLMGSIVVIQRGLEELLQKLMQEGNAPCCLLVDSLFGWGYDVALKFGLPWIDVWIGTASGFCMGFHVPELLARGYIPEVEGLQERAIDFIPGLSPFSLSDLPNALKVAEGPQSPTLQFFLSIFEHVKYADRILANTIYELESSAVDALKTHCGVRIDAIGPLFMLDPYANTPNSPSSLLKEDNSCLAWLNLQKNSSVLYISFGSLATPEDDVFKELAHGLEASGEHFLWVIRADAFAAKGSVEDLLPKGFLERTRERGRVIPWAPQVSVLGHPSVGAFLTHCGWNSVLESLSNGVPMLGFPQMAEQNSNLKLIVYDWKVGLPLLKPGISKMDRTHVQCAVSAIIRKGTFVWERAHEWKHMAPKAFRHTSESNLRKLVEDLKRGDLRQPFPVEV